jgi:hypothetical protein
MASEIIRRGYCSNDTTIITMISDTVYVYTETEEDTLMIGDGTCDFDTILPSGTRVVYQGGMLAVREKIKVRNRVITKQVDSFIKDVAVENVLKHDLKIARDSISQLEDKIQVYKETNTSLIKKLTTNKTYLVLSWILFALLFIFRAAHKLKSL